MGGGYSGSFPTAGDHFAAAGFAASSSAPINSANNGAPKIWRSVDTEQLEAALSNTSEDGVECSNNKKPSEAEVVKTKKENADQIESIDACSELANQNNSRCSSNVSSSQGGEDEGGARCDEDSNDRHTPAVTAVSEDSNHSQSLKPCKDAEGEGGEVDDLISHHSSRGQEHSEAEEEEEDNRASEGEEEDDVDVVSSDSEANHVPAKARSQKRPSSPFDSPAYPSKHRFNHGALYHSHHHHHHHSNHRHHSSDSFHFSHSLVARSDSVSSGTETTPVS